MRDILGVGWDDEVLREVFYLSFNKYVMLLEMKRQDNLFTNHITIESKKSLKTQN